MIRRALQVGLAVVLCLPLARVISLTVGAEEEVDRTSPTWKAREALVARARVFVESPPHPQSFNPGEVIECRYVPKPTKATTPKFDCRLPNGDILKVKYGRTPERYGEVAATRLLSELGFAADQTTMEPALRCIGCPPFPFHIRMLAEWFFAEPLLDALVDENHPREFRWVSVERRMKGRPVEVGSYEGWEWRDLALVDPAKGGAPRAEIDALRLMAAFLAHWDNKASNQRLVCEEDAQVPDPLSQCRTPLLMIQDLGATFGPTKVQYDKWAATPIWTDRATCRVSLEHLPFQGGTFVPVQIVEAGRALLAGKLTQLTETKLRTIFESARFPDPVSGDVPGDVTSWVKTFQEKVRQIAEGSACPTVSPQ